MKKKRVIYSLCLGLASLLICTSVVYATTHDITALLGGKSGDFFDVKGTMLFDSIKVGRQGTGGVTFFNGTIINNTTGTGGADMPVTFGDNVRIDGRIYRGATAGTGDSLPLIINDNMEVAGSLTIGSLASTGVIATANLTDSAVTTAKIADGTIATADLADSAVTSAKITDSTIATADLADSAVTSAKIVDGTIVNADIANNTITGNKISDNSIGPADIGDDAVTADKISPSSVTPIHILGTGGASLPIAYGLVYLDGTCVDVTSNVSCTWNGTQYEITVDGEDFDSTGLITLVTPHTDHYIPATSSNSEGDLIVSFISHDGTPNKTVDFSFLVFNP